MGRLHAINGLGVPVSRSSDFEADKEKVNPESNFARIEDRTELRKTVIQRALANLPEEEWV